MIRFEWRSRLGNNIIQLKNVLHIAIYNDYKIDMPSHPFF